jgi:hypothetical protein
MRETTKRFGVLKGIGFVLSVSALCLALGFGGLMMMGAGHGTDYFFNILTAPFSARDDFFGADFAMYLFWPLLALFIALRRWRIIALFASTVLMAHYAGVLWLQFNMAGEWSYVRNAVFGPGWIIVLLWVAVYVGMQVYFWRLLWPVIIPALTSFRTSD